MFSLPFKKPAVYLFQQKSKTMSNNTNIANTITIGKVTIESVVNYNSRMLSRSMKMENNDGSLKKVGYVACFENEYSYFRTEKQARTFAANPSKSAVVPPYDDQLGA